MNKAALTKRLEGVPDEAEIFMLPSPAICLLRQSDSQL